MAKKVGRTKNMKNSGNAGTVKPPMTLLAYQARADEANQFKGKPDALSQLRFGLFGEVGGLLAAVKKSYRDFGTAQQAVVKEELGDCFWYLTEVSAEYGYALPEVGTAGLTELQRRFRVSSPLPTGQLTFLPFDGIHAMCHEQLPQLDRTKQLSDLGSHVGQLMSITSTPDLVSSTPLVLLAELLADLVTVAWMFGLQFADVITANLEKFESRWPRAGAQYTDPFDSTSPLHERFERKFDVHFIERVYNEGQENERPYVIQQMRRVNIGDRLTDNRTEPDGYRFHDVFHLAYVAHLGWSPVIRALLKLKRKSDPKLDENEDGARAAIIEEGIATWIFNHADRHDFYENTEINKLEYDLLKQVRDMVDGYEVAACPLWQWERAILEGFKVFRQLREAGSGIVTVDMDAHSISFSPLDLPLEPISLPKSRRSREIGTTMPLKPETKS
jgi:NTP pyrophosphatase (non-canonical NTP hydrolase)